MFDLLSIYGMTFSAAGLLTVGTLPSLRGRMAGLLHLRAQQASEQLEELFMEVPTQRLTLLYAISPVVGAALGWVAFRHPLAAVAGTALGAIAPRGILPLMQFKRRRQFAAQLVDALMVLSSSLRAGLSLLQAFEALADEAAAPMSEEIGLVVKETKMGLAFEEALKRLRARMPLDELNLVVITLLVSRETGGDVTALFSKLIETIRERQKIKERITSLTVIPRMQGWLMAMIPAGFAYFALKVSPRYFDMLFQDRTGNLVGMAAVLLWCLGLAMIVWFSRPPR